MEKVKISILSFIGKLFLNFLFLTNRIQINGRKHALNAIKNGRPIMFCCWHGRLLYASYGLLKVKKGLWAIASKHRDAEIMGRILEAWGYRLIRGSSNKGGKEVLRRMTEVFESKTPYICITNDGPKGPKNIAKPGSMLLAKKFNAQIITITGTSEKNIEINSWDKFRLPKPFSKIQITISPPMNYTDQLQIKNDSRYLSDFMNKIQSKSDKCFD